MNSNKQDNGVMSKARRRQKVISCVLTGLLIGFLTAAVIYSNLPGWVPLFLSQQPSHFFGLTMGICAVLGYLWAITPDASDDTKKRAPLVNVMLSGAFVGFLLTAVFFSKYHPTWLPFVFSIYPVLVFIGITLIGAIIGLFWHRTTPPN